eukprot:Rhum_TRINITY_DN10759_c0_g1::Rhum_TRINITY_DN10759_c0_g1_i1::g.40054::m.40054/K10598/PPIL2, CYC4, CHP60; peptidyl-prolyl cis-trans isomerase-like 2
MPGRTKEKSYIKANEREGAVTEAAKEGLRGKFQLLPYNYCALTFIPIEDGVFTEDGMCFERDPLFKYVKEHKVSPVDGSPLTEGHIYPLRLRQNAAGDNYCPVTERVFTEHSHIVAIRTTGNVYSEDAVSKLNVKAKNYTDLLFGNPFKKSDIITLQDPKTIWQKRDASKFFHTQAAGKRKEQLAKKREAAAAAEPEAEKQPQTPLDAEEEADQRARLLIAKEVEHQNRFASAGLTSTANSAVSRNVEKEQTQAEKVQEALFAEYKKRCHGGGAASTEAAVVLDTSLGEVHAKLHCALCPRTAYNFLKLAESKYYNGTVFHRVVPGFVMQGGDPKGTGTGGESCWGGTFKDEIMGRLRHDKRGVLSMANSGKDTNGSQFFLTLGAAPHLDGKHSVFGQVTAGFPVLDQADAVPTDAATERPLVPVTLNAVHVYSNPFAELEAEVSDRLDPARQADRAEKAKAEKASGEERRPWMSAPQPVLPNQGSAEVGKYMPAAVAAAEAGAAGEAAAKGKKEKKEKKEKKGKKRAREEAPEGEAADAERQLAAAAALRSRLGIGAKPTGGFDFSKW